MMSEERIILGRFTLEHRVIEAYQVAGGSTTSVRLRRLAPEPAVELGYITRIGQLTAKLHLYRAEWSADLRRTAKQRAMQVWAHAARFETEIDAEEAGQ
jgi:hypothetical protein